MFHISKILRKRFVNLIEIQCYTKHFPLQYVQLYFGYRLFWKLLRHRKQGTENAEKHEARDNNSEIEGTEKAEKQETRDRESRETGEKQQKRKRDKRQGTKNAETQEIIMRYRRQGTENVEIQNTRTDNTEIQEKRAGES